MMIIKSWHDLFFLFSVFRTVVQGLVFFWSQLGFLFSMKHVGRDDKTVITWVQAWSTKNLVLSGKNSEEWILFLSVQHLVLAQLKLGTVPQTGVDNVESLVLCPLATSLGAVEPRGWGLLGQPPAGSICQSWEEESEYIYISTSLSKQPPSSLAKVLG